MKLTKGRKQKILERFADGESIAVIADWYERSPKQIEDCDPGGAEIGARCACKAGDG